MNRTNMLGVVLLAVVSSPVWAQPASSADAQRGDAWTKELTERSKRGTLHDAFQNVRGDSGKWNDEATALHAPPFGKKRANVSLDDWFDELLEANVQTAAGDDNWLLVRTRQLNDNDRAWVNRVERRGDQFTVHISEADWEGAYRKNFTYYNTFGVNLGKLPPGKYTANVIIQPLLFKQFEGPGRPADNWSKDERPSETRPVELPVEFTVAAPSQ